MNLDDPKLTAYALDELDERERAEMARESARSPDAQEVVNETQALGRLLRAEFAAELKKEIGDGTEHVPPGEARLSANLSDIRDDPWFWSVARPLAIAAVIAIFAVIGGGVFLLSRHPGAVGSVSSERMIVTGSNIPTAEEVAQSPVEAELQSEALSRTAKSAPLKAKPGAPAEFFEKVFQSDPNAVGGMYRQDFNTADYGHYVENAFLTAKSDPLSTFSIDVDTASYSIVRRFLNEGHLPPKDAVRIEEMINYFSYDYAQPKADEPFSINLEVASCPWEDSHRLVRIGLKGREVPQDNRGASNLVFLLDVSGSMEPSDRLPLVKQAMRLLVEKLTEKDRVAIVVYAGASGVALPSTTGANKEQILSALENLQAGGSTNGAEGIQLAYKIAADNFIKGGINRVILVTDGDFNVGVTSQGELIRLIEEKAKTGMFLSVLGVGDNNLKDGTMQKLADKGNGNHAYLDSIDEARKLLVQQMNGTLVTIAKDVKVQVEWNPAQVASYRLIGYEKRMLRKEDFNNDKIDAGEIGAGHTVTALYEVVPVGAAAQPSVPLVDALKYSSPGPPTTTSTSKEMLTVKLRYKKPDGDKSELIERSLIDDGNQFAKASADFKWAAAVAESGMLLRDSKFKGNATFVGVRELAEEGMGTDANGYRAGFIQLVRKAEALKKG
jgi:Ca-activated chloride channel family protein